MNVRTWWIYKQCAAHNSWKWVKSEAGKAKQDVLETWAMLMALASCTVLPTGWPCLEKLEAVHISHLEKQHTKGDVQNQQYKKFRWLSLCIEYKNVNISPYYTCISTAESVFSFSKQRTIGLTFCGHGCHWISVFQKQRVNESSKLPLQQG